MIAPLPFHGDDAALLAALRMGHPSAAAVFYDRHAAHVHRTLVRTLGPDAELPDLLQEVFITAIDRIGDLDEPERVASWLTTIAIFTARACIRRRKRRRWLSVFAPDRGDATQAPPAPGVREALRQVYDVLTAFPVDERVAFALRIVDGMPLGEAAQAAGVSLATFKRRLARAETRFLAAARSRPALAEWMEEGTRWNREKRA